MVLALVIATWSLSADLKPEGPAVVRTPAVVEIRINEPGEDPYTWSFEPSEVKVERGTTVVWRNVGAYVHTVTADDESFASPNLGPGEEWRWRFAEAGRLPYYCSPHPWMKGIVQVVA